MIERDVTELQPHPKNREIYGDDIEQATKQSIEENGIREPLTITPDGTIISGHQRWEIAKQLGIESVPVDVREYENESDELEALLDYNRQREKTPGQKIKEGMAYESVQNFARGSGRVQNQVGERIGMSGENYRKGKYIYNSADDGDPVAQAQWDSLMASDTTIHRAYTTIKDAEGASNNSQATHSKTDTPESSGDDSDGVSEIKESDSESTQFRGTENRESGFYDCDFDEQLFRVVYTMTDGQDDKAVTTEEIADNTLWSKPDILSLLEELRDDGKVIKKEVGETAVWWPDGREAILTDRVEWNGVKGWEIRSHVYKSRQQS